MKTLRRFHIKKGKSSPATIRETFDIPIVEDNLVCVHCKAHLGLVEWTIVSMPKHKGLIAFACKECVGPAMKIVAAAFGLNQEERDIKLPEPGDN